MLMNKAMAKVFVSFYWPMYLQFITDKNAVVELFKTNIYSGCVKSKIQLARSEAKLELYSSVKLIISPEKK